MSILSTIVAGILAGYLALINGTANLVVSYLAPDGIGRTSTEIIDTGTGFTGGIPDILLKSAPYQNATVIEATPETTPTAAPLQALVNIFCSFATADAVRSATGSGFFIGQNGVIVTNAHVAQFLILDEVLDGEGGCVIRTGNPAVPTYTADLLYISPAWIQEHAALLKESVPRGTGERDYALLYVTGSTNDEPLPETFPAMRFNTNLMTTGAIDAPVRAAGYPAHLMASQGSAAPLTGIEVGTTITELMTFGSRYADLFSIAGTEIGERGSSGGPVAIEDGQAIGLIVTRGDDAAFGKGSLRAISISYIDRTIREETGYGLRENMSGDLSYRARVFRETIVPFLAFLLEKNLQ